jgi:hypothetical protein
MDFAAMLRPVAFTGRPEEAGQVPRPVTIKAKSRKLAALREVEDILTVLPEEGKAFTRFRPADTTWRTCSTC